MLAKKAEAAQRRKMQVEKATKESEVRKMFACLPFKHILKPRFQGVLNIVNLCRLKL
jgi:hypothetical protein